jgi:hypothetical protein
VLARFSFALLAYGRLFAFDHAGGGDGAVGVAIEHRRAVADAHQVPGFAEEDAADRRDRLRLRGGVGVGGAATLPFAECEADDWRPFHEARFDFVFLFEAGEVGDVDLEPAVSVGRRRLRQKVRFP